MRYRRLNLWHNNNNVICLENVFRYDEDDSIRKCQKDMIKHMQRKWCWMNEWIRNQKEKNSTKELNWNSSFLSLDSYSIYTNTKMIQECEKELHTFFPWKHNQRRRSNEWMNEKMTTSSRITRKNEWTNDNDMQTWTPFERKEMRNGWWKKKIDRNKGNLKIYMVCVCVCNENVYVFFKEKNWI